VLAGSPGYDGPPRRGQGYEGTDRKVRGDLVQLLRDSSKPLSRKALAVVDPDPQRVDRLLDALVQDGLVEPLARARFRLPH
jgi:A/G-specific adenine glycosylase